MTPTQLMLACLVLPLAASLLSLLLKGNARLRDLCVLAVGLLLLGVSVQLLSVVLDGAAPVLTLVDTLPGAPLQLALEPLGMLFALILASLWPIASLYSVSYLEANKESHRSRFHACFALSIFGAMLVALSGNLFTLFVGYEILTLATYPLVAHHGDRKAIHGGRVYLALLLGTSIALLLPAIMWTWDVSGTLEFRPQGILAGNISEASAGLLLLMFGYGIGKGALMPLHRWLPAAMVAPAPVSALLHAVAVVKAGVFTLLKVMVYIFGIDFLGELTTTPLLMGIASATVIIASLIAMRQDNLKRRLAYSTVSQLSYVLLGVLILAPLSLVGAALHLAAHAFGKITLFFAAGAIHTASHKTCISQLGGIGYRMPWTMGAFAVGALSMIGLPLLAGFVSKWYLLLGAWQAEHMLALLVIVASTLLNAAYFVPILRIAWFGKADEQAAHGEAPRGMLLALLLTASLTLLIGLFPQIPLQLASALPGVGPIAISGLEP